MVEDYNDDDAYDVSEDTESQPIPFGVKVVYGVLGVALIVVIAAWLLKGYPDRWVYLQTFILALTLVVVAIYTYLTRNMQQAMVRQTNVSILPSFEVVIVLEGEIDPCPGLPPMGRAVQSRLELKNVGQGVALNVHVESVLVDCRGRYGPDDYLPTKFEKIFSLSPDQKRVVKDTQPYDLSKVRAVNGLGRLDLLGLIAKGRTFPKPELKIWFTDILGNKYVQVIHMSRHGIWSDVVQPDKKQINRNTITFNRVEW
jgi:hypothetical protein